MYGASTGFPAIMRSTRWVAFSSAPSASLPLGHSSSTRKMPYQNEPIAMYGVPSAPSTMPASMALKVLPPAMSFGELITGPWSTHA